MIQLGVPYAQHIHHSHQARHTSSSLKSWVAHNLGQKETIVQAVRGWSNKNMLWHKVSDVAVSRRFQGKSQIEGNIMANCITLPGILYYPVHIETSAVCSDHFSYPKEEELLGWYQRWSPCRTDLRCRMDHDGDISVVILPGVVTKDNHKRQVSRYYLAEISS